tara:strand:- start:4132 stop:4845 length:714 start_codon:yes stop_codon:yes gene_type:complete
MLAFSKMFGKKQTIDPNKIDAFMAPYGALVDQQEGIANSMMDSDSLLSVNRRNLLRRENFDLVGQQNQNMQSTAAMGGMSAGQMAANQRANNSSARGQMGQQFAQQESNQYNQGLSLLGQVTGQRKGQGEQQANTYIQGVNAHNANRRANMQMGMDVLSTGMKMAGSDISLKENIELVGKSPSGVNVYTFDYKNKDYGEGRYKGVMAQEVPDASSMHKDGYLQVDYNKLDVDFERVM